MREESSLPNELTLEQSTVSGNSATDNGGGIYFDGTATVALQQSRVPPFSYLYLQTVTGRDRFAMKLLSASPFERVVREDRKRDPRKQGGAGPEGDITGRLHPPTPRTACLWPGA
jgi:predicted outer membrane repeat protein